MITREEWKPLIVGRGFLEFAGSGQPKQGPFESLQLGVLGAGLFQDRDIRVSILP